MWLRKLIEQRRQTIEDMQSNEETKEEEAKEEKVEEVAATASGGFDPDDHPNPEGEVECHWCERNTNYEVEIEEGKEEYTTRCHGCKLKVWIQGDGWEKYAEIHDLELGCKTPVEIRSDSSSDGSDSPFGSITIDEQTIERIRDRAEERRRRTFRPPSPSDYHITTSDIETAEAEIRTDAISEAAERASQTPESED